MTASTTSSTIKATVDLHCHILPAWDDGPRTLEDALTMVRQAAEAGIDTIFATPHVGRAFRGVEHPAASIAQGVAKLQQEIDAAEIPVKILPGAEILLGAVDLLAESTIAPEWTYGGQGRYILVESAYAIWPDYGNHLVHELLRRGVTPIIAHPERYLNVQKNSEILGPALRQGAVLQVTAENLAGRGPKALQQCALRLLDEGKVHVVASDSHTPDVFMPQLTAELICERVGPGRARQILETNPQALVRNEYFPHQAELERPRQNLLGRLLRRN